MRTRLFRAALILGAAQAALVAAACVDVTPVNPSLEDQPDAGSDASACESCVAAPDDAGAGCASELAACEAIPVCKTAFACAESSGCFDLPSAQDFLQCGLACNTKVGLQENAAALKAAQSTVGCIFGSCGVACGWMAAPDAGK